MIMKALVTACFLICTGCAQSSNSIQEDAFPFPIPSTSASNEVKVEWLKRVNREDQKAEANGVPYQEWPGYKVYIKDLERTNPEAAKLEKDIRTGTWTYRRARDVLRRSWPTVQVLGDVLKEIDGNLQEKGVDPSSVPGLDALRANYRSASVLLRAVQQNISQFKGDEGKPKDREAISLDPGRVVANSDEFVNDFDVISNDEAMKRILKWAPILQERIADLMDETGQVMAEWADSSLSS